MFTKAVSQFGETAFFVGVVMKPVLQAINAMIWGIPVLMMILMTGVHLSVRTGFAQIRFFTLAVKHFFKNLQKSDHKSKTVSGYRALCTALAATVGTGNIAGVAGAIAIGGPGVIVWMWISAILGMITKFAEVTLALYYREGKRGEYVGGPMYMIQNGLSANYHILAYIYCFFGVVAALGIGNAVQVNAVVDGVRNILLLNQMELPIFQRLLLGLVLCSIIVPIFKKGICGIGRTAEKLVPVASVIYILMALMVLTLRFEQIPAAISIIIQGAFSPGAVTGGVISSVFLTLRTGVARGVFTNEAGMGTASIAHAASDVTHPAEQGLMGIMEVFLDTIVICTMTALVILCSGISIPYGTDPGIALTLDAFSTVLGNWSKILLTILTCVFAFATILGWGLYGARCLQYLLGEHIWDIFIYAQSVAVILGVILDTSSIWILSEIVNGLMAIPNLIAVTALSGTFMKIFMDFQRKENAHRLR